MSMRKILSFLECLGLAYNPRRKSAAWKRFRRGTQRWPAPLSVRRRADAKGSQGGDRAFYYWASYCWAFCSWQRHPQSMLRGSCLAGLVATRCSQAEEESVPRAADAVEVSKPDTEATAEAESASNAPAADSRYAAPAPNDVEATPNLLETNAAVSDFARKLSEKLKIAGPRNIPSRARRGMPRCRKTPAREIAPCAARCWEYRKTRPSPNGRNWQWKKVPHVDWQFQSIEVEDAAAQNATKEKLQPGEPAQVILELREKLGNSAVNGTEFTVTPQQFAKWVRALDEEIHEQEAEQPSPTLRQNQLLTSIPPPTKPRSLHCAPRVGNWTMPPSCSNSRTCLNGPTSCATRPTNCGEMAGAVFEAAGGAGAQHEERTAAGRVVRKPSISTCR